jgi:hypothetical protein
LKLHHLSVCLANTHDDRVGVNVINRMFTNNQWEIE